MFHSDVAFLGLLAFWNNYGVISVSHDIASFGASGELSGFCFLQRLRRQEKRNHVRHQQEGNASHDAYRPTWNRSVLESLAKDCEGPVSGPGQHDETDDATNRELWCLAGRWGIDPVFAKAYHSDDHDHPPPDATEKESFSPHGFSSLPTEKDRGSGDPADKYGSYNFFEHGLGQFEFDCPFQVAREFRSHDSMTARAF